MAPRGVPFLRTETQIASCEKDVQKCINTSVDLKTMLEETL